MKVAIFDIDDTITYESKYLEKHAPSFLRKRGFCSELCYSSAYGLAEKYDLRSQLIQKGKKPEDAEVIALKTEEDFWTREFLMYNLSAIRTGIKAYIDFLKKHNFQIWLLTLRGGDERIKKIAALITKTMLHRNRIAYDHIVFCRDLEEKIEYIKYLNPFFLFDDREELLQHVCGMLPETRAFLIDNPHNLKALLPPNAVRIKDCFDESLRLIDCKTKNRLKTNEQTATSLQEWFQAIVKRLFGWIFFLNHAVIVFGKENIPAHGGIAFVPNHRNKLDPVYVSLTSGKSIHYAALLRMFQGKEDLFKLDSARWKRVFSAWLIKAMGALPIARETDENFFRINAGTVKRLKELLRMDRVIGFFPEGTINRTGVGILPLKSNRIFKMARDTGCYIVPVAISWNDSGDSLKLSYGKAINPENRSPEMIHELWKGQMDVLLSQLEGTSGFKKTI